MVTDATMHDEDDTGLLAQLGPVANTGPVSQRPLLSERSSLGGCFMAGTGRFFGDGSDLTD
jgi:hypothetical protein